MKLFKTSSFWQAFLVSLILVIFFLYSSILNVNKPIELARGDTFHVILTLKHYMNVVTANDWKNILTMPTFYGFKDSVLYSELFIFEAVLSLPFYLITSNIITSYNIVALLSMAASSFTMFLFTKYVTNKFWPSVIASLVYVFNPFVIGHYPDNLHYYSLYFIPLIFLYLEKFLKDHSNKNAFLIFLFLTLQSLTALTFGALLTVILPIYAVIRLIQSKLIKKPIDIKKFVNIGGIIGLIIFTFTIIGIERTYNIYFNGEPIVRNAEETATFAPWVSDLFQTSPNNILYGWTRGWFKENIPQFSFGNPEYIERNLFLGFGVWILLIMSFKLRKSEYKNLWLISLFCAFLCLILSFGPRVRFTESFSIPGIYGIVRAINPLLQDLRVSSRFMFLGYFFIALVAGISATKLGKTFIFIILAVILIEFSSIPWKYETIPQNVLNLYNFVQKQKDINVLVEMPMGNLFTFVSLADNQFIESSYMLYASQLHSKSILNGYSSYTPIKYPARVEYLSFNFPTPSKIDQLKKWGVDAIVLHKDFFKNKDDYDTIEKGLLRLKVKEIYNDNSGLSVFRIK